MNKKKLEDLLWGAAEFLRGQIDASDYTPRGQVFGFLKQLEVHCH